jgi:predicted nucleic acid-binding protein
VSEPDDLLGLAFAAACRLGLPAIYDAHYVALAEAAGGELWTDDRRLVRLVGDRSPRLRWIGDEPSRR